MTPPSPLFTVFTPTFNRAHTLPRVLASLQAQGERDFEWLIIDDGSTDGTKALVDRWQQTSDFPIRYVWQPNQGKHVAFNRAVREARGTLFVPLDSDDTCVPEALQRLREYWEEFTSDEQRRLSGITCRCMDEQGRLIGPPFPRDRFDSDAREMFYRHRISAELWGAARLNVLREFAFDESIVGSYVPEGMIWFRIAERYQGRYVNDALRIYHQDEPSIMRSSSPGRHSAGARLATMAALRHDLRYFRYAPLEFLRQAGLYVRFSLHQGVPLLRQIRDLPGVAARTLGMVMLPAGVFLYWRDRRRTAGEQPRFRAAP